MSTTLTAFEGKMAELKARFGHKLPARLDAIAAALDSARTDTRPETIDELRRHFHSLAGTAGTYALTDLAAIAHRAELVCDSILDDRSAFGSLASLLNELVALSMLQTAA
jgi:chemotaxis protein histidine kinase CheA